MIYRYFGLIFGMYRTRVAILSSRLHEPGAHVAVWAGVNAPHNRSWLQAGVMREYEDMKPLAYIEVGPPGPHYSLRTFALGDREAVKVRLRRRGGLWQATLIVGDRTHVSRRVAVGKPVTLDATLEVLGKASASAMIGSRVVRGGIS